MDAHEWITSLLIVPAGLVGSLLGLAMAVVAPIQHEPDWPKPFAAGLCLLVCGLALLYGALWVLDVRITVES